MFESLRYSLKNNRKGVMKNATAWFLFSAIILVFVFWGLAPQQPGVAEGGAVAIVNDRIVSQAQLAEMTERLSRDPRFQQLEALGADAGRQILQRQALSQLVQGELIRQQTQDLHILTTDAEVRDIITGIPNFQEEGRFKRDLYMGYLQAVRKSPAEFEEEVRRDQSWRRAIRMFSSALRPLPLEIEKQSELEKMKANLEFVSIPTESLVSPTTLKDSEAENYLAQEGVGAKVKEYYDNHKEEFSSAEQVKARHILIQAKPGDVDSEKKARETIEKLAERAKTEDFAKLAREHSEDPGSKSDGGLLDYFERDMMVPEFSEAAFSTPVREISAPVKTAYGFHLIQVLDKKAASTQSLEDARLGIAKKLMAQERSKQALESLEAMLKNGENSGVNKFVSEHKLKWEETGSFSIDADTVPKIGTNDEVIRTAFLLNSQNPMADSLIRQGATALLVRHKPVPAPKAAKEGNANEPGPEMLAEMVASRRSDDALRQWLQATEKAAQVTYNPQYSGMAE